MDSRKDSVSALKLCRFCLTQNDPLSSLYNRSKAPKTSVPLSLKILSCVGVEVFPSDKMPQYICNRCKFFMDLSYGFKQICRQADERILQFIQDGTTLDSVSWPQALSKIYKSSSKSSEVGMVEAVTQSGTTVQVMAEEVSGSEDGDDDNVYNVKIGDGPEEAKRIKVVTSDKDTGNKRNRKDSEDDRVANVSDGGCWPCDECDCTYPLEQLLSLHKAQKHRARTVECDECDAKFFSKYDLITHQLIHSADTPFQCVACGKKFKRHILLKRHEKLIHSELPQQVCPHCPATFLSTEELEAHQKRHKPYQDRPYLCNFCDKRFHDKSILQKHKECVHNKKTTFSCQYCPEQFPTVSKLTRHVKAHAGERPYPCKHCDKSFLKSHHYTRHLRVKHSETLRAPSGSYVECESNRCMECEESFATQDELMYHSALHATRNLVCPLCQEKFDSVDDVTAHIKSHVNGTEFMCDFCELIFITKEKLDSHIASIHEEELMANEQEMEPDESSLDAEDDDEDNSINLKEENGQMVVEIKKAEEFMLPVNQADDEEKNDNTQSEDSETEGFPELPQVSLKENVKVVKNPVSTPAVVKVDSPVKVDPPKQTKPIVTKPADTSDHQNQTASILKKAEAVKLKVIEQQAPTPDKSEKKEKTINNNKVESTTATPPAGANDKSLRLLEKELQDLKRTNTRSDSSKTPAKSVENLRKRPLQHTSTPKTSRPVEKKEVANSKATPDKTVPEKKVLERRIVTKDKDKVNAKEKDNGRDEKEEKNNKEDPPKEDKKEQKETPKAAVKNGVSEKSTSEESVRRSTRPSKVKDYAKMVRDRSDDESEEEESEEIEPSEQVVSRGRPRKSVSKPSPVASVSKPVATVVPTTTTTPAAPKKRGRPRKDQTPVVPVKVKKSEPSTPEPTKSDNEATQKIEDTPPKETEITNASNEHAMQSPDSTNLLMSPTGQTLKKVPMTALPPGIKPLPLPRALGAGEVCEMQIGKKVVKVQKIVMTKAEVEAMAKKGLVEMKDGTMVLKQGIKLPASDPNALKSTLVGETDKTQESPKKD